MFIYKHGQKVMQGSRSLFVPRQLDRINRTLRSVRALSSDPTSADHRYHLLESQRNLFSESPVSQLSALQSLLTLSHKYGFPPGSLPPIVLERIIGYAFGDHDSFRVHEVSLHLLESLCRGSPWTVPFFREKKVDETCFRQISFWASGLPQRDLTFVVIAMMDLDCECYRRMMEMGFFDFVLKSLQNVETEFCDFPWLLNAIHSMIVSRLFDRFGELPVIAGIALVGLDERADALRVPSIYILATVLVCESREVRAMVATSEVLARVVEFLDVHEISDVGAPLDFLTNFVAISDEMTMKAVNADVLEKLHG
jgi:hypothetical protein